MKNLFLLFTLLAFLGCSNTQKGRAAADLIVINARIWTGNNEQPWAEAMAISGDTIVAVGTSAGIKAIADATTKTIDAKGQLVTPGFTDSHVHFVDAGFNLTAVQLRDAHSKEEFISRIAAFAKTLPKGAWIQGGDWDHTNWGSILPEASWIDAVTPDNPVWIQRLDGHMGLANTVAMKTAGVNALTKNIEGGTIIRDAKGNPTGIFKDNAMDLIGKVTVDPPAALKDKALEAAMAYVAERGVTSIQNMGSWDELSTFRRAQATGELKTRIFAAVPLSTWQRLRDTITKSGRGDKWLQIGGLKGFSDGSLGSHTAAMLEPYTDKPGDKGLNVTPLKDLYNYVSGADKAGLQVMIHAIGDRGNREILDIYEKVMSEDGPRDRRFRIEHAQHIHPNDIPRFGKLGVIASMQPYHCIDDGRWAEPLIGKIRCKTTYAFRDLIDTKAMLTFGSDWFVAPPTPLEGIYAAVTRRTLDDKNPDGWYPQQKITVVEALRAYTCNPAYASFDENQKGMLKPGMLADFVILSQDLTKIAPEKIRDVKVVMTVVGGKVVYSENK